MEMKKYKLGEIAEILVGYPFESEKFNTEGKGIRLVRGMNVSERFLRFGDDSRWWNNLTEDLLPYYLKENDIVIGMDGSKVGKNFALVKKEDLPLILVQRVACIRAKKGFEQNYIWQYISSFRFIEYVNTIKTGSAIPHISGSQIGNFPIFVPSYGIQKKIAKVLSVLDDKIALNRRINAKLEAMAKRLYDYWFVQFDFPTEDGKPYKSSGGKMEYNATLNREIPAGWEVKRLESMVSLQRGISYSKDNLVDEGTPMISLASFSPDSSYKIESIKHYKGITESSDCLKPFDLLMCTVQQTDIDYKTDIVGKTILVPDVFNENPVFTTDLVKVNVECDIAFIINYETQTKWYNKYITGFASGTSIKHLNVKGFLDYPLSVPADKTVLSQFSKLLLNIKKQQSIKLREIQKLTAMRDRLLPLLMNGQLEVE